jgi:DNA-binding transcriptional ArsR family regulator/uncharacterized protein YndB with AHSA1/START domain
MSDDPDQIWKALSDPTRRAVLDMLRAGPMATGAIAERFELSRFGVMKHIEILHACRLITVERRGRERWNYLNAARLQEATDRWLSLFHTLCPNQTPSPGKPSSEEPLTQEQTSPLALDIRQQTEFPASRQRVFSALTQDINQWWDDAHRQTGAGGMIVLEPAVGTDMIERADNGHSVVWGRVEEVCRPERLYLSGCFGVADAMAGRLHFDLEGMEGDCCRLRLRHQVVGGVSKEMLRRFENGWRELIGGRLLAFIKSQD